MKKPVITILILISGITSASTALRWPLDRPRRVTGTFGEYRGLMYHHGVDVSTAGKKGFRVFAADNGYVSSVMYQKWGIGYAIFMKHESGLMTFYGHLDRFASVILRNKRIKGVREKIRNREDFRIDFQKPEIKVRRGGVIGYTGDTGRGPAHFHFETRNSSNIPVNPLKNGIWVPDRTAPVITEVYLVPLDAHSHVDNSPNEYVISAKPVKRSKRLYVLNTGSIPEIGGNIGIKIKAYDRAGYRNRVSLYGIKAKINGKEAYSIRLDSVKREESHRMGLVFDYDNSSYREFTYFLYSRKNHKGAVHSGDKNGLISISITCSDANNNRSEINFKLKSNGMLKKPAYKYVQNLKIGRELKLRKKDFTIKFDEKAALYDERVVLESGGYDNFFPLLTVKSSAYSVSPTNLCLDRPAEIVLKYSGKDYKKIGIYKKSGRFFYFIGNTYDSKNRSFKVHINKMGTFFLIKDESPPVIRFRDRLKRKRNRSIVIRIRDIGSGVDLKKVSLKVDGKDVIWDYEIDKRYIEILPHNRIWKRGKHIIHMVIEDRAGNSSGKQQFTYFI